MLHPDKASPMRHFMNNHLTWDLVDSVADDLGALPDARRKWRVRQVPYYWQIKIATELMRRGIAVALGDFEKLNP